MEGKNAPKNYFPLISIKIEKSNICELDSVVWEWESKKSPHSNKQVETKKKVKHIELFTIIKNKSYLNEHF